VLPAKGLEVVERIDDMPAGTIGFRATGKLSREDYRNVMEPDLRRAAESGDIRMVFQLTDFGGLEPGAWFEDVKTGLGLGLGHHSAWKRSAIVTDVEWVGKHSSCSLDDPGEVDVFGLDQVEEAKRWVAG
jgi:hypothetical protein